MFDLLKDFLKLVIVLYVYEQVIDFSMKTICYFDALNGHVTSKGTECLNNIW